MQIIPNGGSWSNAAASQQISQGAAGSSKPSNKSTSTLAGVPLEHSEKAGDRDAQERYEGSLRDDNRNPSDSKNAKENESGQESLLQLPAMDEEPSQLDLRM